jgi:uncharacterized caspase-like protein
VLHDRLTHALLVGLALLASAPFAAARPAENGRKVALLVGVSQYRSESLKSLKYAERDVEELAEVLRSCGYAADDVKVLTHREAARDRRRLPSRRNVLEALAALLKDRSPNDTVLIAFAGHGVQFRDDAEVYFCPADADLARSATLLALADVYRQLADCPAGVKLVLTDACRNDPSAPSRLHPRSAKPQRRPLPSGVVALFGCSEGQEAYEDDGLRHGVFFHYVLEGLRGKAALPDRRVTLRGLCDYVTEPVDEHVRRAGGGSQRPSVLGEPSDSVTLAVR